MSCDYSLYVGYTIAELQPLIDEAKAALQAVSQGKLVQRVALGDMSIAFSNAALNSGQIAKTLAALRAALAAAQASPDGVVPAPRLARPIFPWTS